MITQDSHSCAVNRILTHRRRMNSPLHGHSSFLSIGTRTYGVVTRSLASYSLIYYSHGTYNSVYSIAIHSLLTHYSPFNTHLPLAAHSTQSTQSINHLSTSLTRLFSIVLIHYLFNFLLLTHSLTFSLTHHPSQPLAYIHASLRPCLTHSLLAALAHGRPHQTARYSADPMALLMAACPLGSPLGWPEGSPVGWPDGSAEGSLEGSPLGWPDGSPDG